MEHLNALTTFIKMLDEPIELITTEFWPFQIPEMELYISFTVIWKGDYPFSKDFIFSNMMDIKMIDFDRKAILFSMPLETLKLMESQEEFKKELKEYWNSKLQEDFETTLDLSQEEEEIITSVITSYLSGKLLSEYDEEDKPTNKIETYNFIINVFHIMNEENEYKVSDQKENNNSPLKNIDIDIIMHHFRTKDGD